MFNESLQFEGISTINDRMRDAGSNGVFATSTRRLLTLTDNGVLSPLTSGDDLRAVAREENVIAYTFDLVRQHLSLTSLDLGEAVDPANFTIIDQTYLGPNGNEYHPLPKYLPHHVAEAFIEMNDAYSRYMAETDLFRDKPPRPGLIVQSGFRSPAYQFAVMVKKIGQIGVDKTANVMTRPGASQHHDQINTAVDINSLGDWHGKRIYPNSDPRGFEMTPEFDWLLDNSPQFGFWLPYHPNPASPTTDISASGVAVEPWHLRYIGNRAQSLTDHYNIVGLFRAYQEARNPVSV